MPPRSKIAVSWLEIILVILLITCGMGIWSFIDQEINQSLKGKEPALEKFQQDLRLPQLQRELNLAQEELTIIRKKLLEHRIEQDRQSAKLKFIEKTHPQVLQGDSNIAQSSEITRTYKSVQTDWAVADGTIDALETQHETLKAWVDTQTRVVFDNQEAASGDFDTAKLHFDKEKQWLILKRSILYTVITLLILFLLILGVAKKLNVSILRPFLASGALLSVLFAYQAFNAMGAALISSIILIIILSILTKRVR
jgi:hypothetical protein